MPWTSQSAVRRDKASGPGISAIGRERERALGRAAHNGWRARTRTNIWVAGLVHRQPSEGLLMLPRNARKDGGWEAGWVIVV